MDFNPQRVISDLKELRLLTETPAGAQRAAWTETWLKARSWYKEKVSALPVSVEQDEAGNIWATLNGKSEQSLIIGSHMDSVPNGGWLDGCLGVLSGLEILRRVSSQGTPSITVHLVDWADEEGITFGRSMFGSGAVAGSLKAEDIRDYHNKEGLGIAEVVAKYGVHLDHIERAHERLKKVSACLEFHIEQGPVLESKGVPLGVVMGAVGIERHAIRFRGQSVHAGFMSMDMRRDALAAAARLELEIRQIGKKHGGLCTMGKVTCKPGIITALVGECEITLDQRHFDGAGLQAMCDEALAACQRIAAEENVSVEWSRLYHIEPTRFHPELMDFTAEAIRQTGCEVHYLPSGPLHDAAEICMAGIPTAMLFVQSIKGLSHINVEDTREEHLLLGIQAFDHLVTRTMQWITEQQKI